MRRSEMVLILRTVLKLNHADDAYAFQRGEISLGALADRVIPSILSRIEKEGMLPPPAKFIAPTYEGKIEEITDHFWENE